MIVVMGFVVACVLLAWLRVRRGRNAVVSADQARAGLGPTVDLVSVVVGSGGTIRQAVEAVADHGTQSVAGSFASAVADADGGMLLADALERSSTDLGSIYHPLIGALVATERDGAPVSLLLQRLADDAEQARRWQIEAMARRLPVTMLVPLVTCLLPATVIGTVVPLVLVAVRHLQS